MDGTIKFELKIINDKEAELTLDVGNMNIAPSHVAIPLDLKDRKNIEYLWQTIGSNVCNLIAYDCRIGNQAGLYTSPEHKATRILTGEA